MIAPTYGSRELDIERGSGVYLYDANGREYIDCFSNVGVNILGHNVKEINEAVNIQISKLTNLHGSFENSVRNEFASRIVHSCGLHSVFFCNSGTESVEAALKFSRLTTGCRQILAAKLGYHGKTMGSLSLTHTDKKYRDSFVPLLPETAHFTFNDIESLRMMMSDDTAAVIVEPIQGESGIRPATKEFMLEVRKLCDEHEALMIVDEVQSGIGRTGKMWAYQHFDILPDMICAAKGLAGGLPCGATIINSKIAEKLFKGCHTNTFGGNPLVCASGIATFDFIKNREVMENAEEVGNYFIRRLRNIKSGKVREVRGKGLMIGVELKTRATEYIKALQDRGVLAFPSGRLVIRFLPPLIITKEQVDTVVNTFEGVLHETD